MHVPGVSKERVSEAVESVKTNEELRRLYDPTENQEPAWLRWLKDFFDFGSSSSDSSFDPALPRSSGILDALPYIVAGGVILLVVVGLVFAFTRSSRARKRAAETDSEERRAKLVSEQLELAHAALEAGDLSSALRAYWAALVTGLGRGNELVYRAAWTCREMLTRSRGEGSDVELLARLLPRIERLEFGRVEIRLADVEELRELCAERLS
jgi:uncharacterized protein YpmB